MYCDFSKQLSVMPVMFSMFSFYYQCICLCCLCGVLCLLLMFFCLCCLCGVLCLLFNVFCLCCLCGVLCLLFNVFLFVLSVWCPVYVCRAMYERQLKCRLKKYIYCKALIATSPLSELM